MPGPEIVEIEVVRLPHGRDLALPDYATAAAAGADLLAAIDQDIELTIPLDRVVDVSLPDAPLDFSITDIHRQFGNGPDITRVVPFIQLGGEGAFVYTNAIDGEPAGRNMNSASGFACSTFSM